MSSSDAATATKAGAAAARDLLGSTWGPPRPPIFAGATIAGRCGNPRAGLGAPTTGLLSSATSPVFFSEPELTPGLPGSTYVRTAVVAYDNDEHAKAAYDELGEAAFEDCLAAAVNTYNRGDHPDAAPVPDATADSFDTTSAPSFTGDQAILIGTTFDQELLGGADNINSEALFVARSGTLVVTAIVSVSGQILDAKDSTTPARRLGASALTRANAAA